MSYDPTQRVPPPQEYPPQPGYTQPAYPPQQPGYPPAYPPQAPAPQTYPQYGTPPLPPGAGFDFASFWKKLGQTGQVGAISGLLLFILCFVPWFNVGVTCNGSLCDVSNRDYSYNAFSIIGSVSPANANESFGFPLILLVILASLVLIGLPIAGAMGKMAARQVQLFMLITAGVALLIEIFYMFSAFGAFPKETGSQTFEDTTVKVTAGPAAGFWLGLLATLAAGGIYIYLAYIKKPAGAGYPLPYQQVAQYPGSQPYPPQPPYPGSQPYAPPTQYQQPPQYPGQQPPQYPGQ
ncbi:MAG TPA: hypothetical protein VH590_19070 [Ktedonobacterales bacterium]|jgi:hypothetical protein